MNDPDNQPDAWESTLGYRVKYNGEFLHDLCRMPIEIVRGVHYVLAWAITCLFQRSVVLLRHLRNWT